MSKQFLPQTRKTRAEPLYHVVHKKSAAAGLKLKEPGAVHHNFTNHVPVFQGASARLINWAKSQIRYRTKLASPKWQKKAKAIRKARLKAAA